MGTGRRAVFLDRDDTLCKDVPYCRRPEDLHLLPGAGEAVRRLNDAGLVVVIITNQSGIARGWLTEEDLRLIHEKMKKDLSAFGAKVDAIYHCPHHPDDDCDCRKPKPSLVFKAAIEMDLQLETSYMIGDRILDVLLARNSGTKAVLVRPPHPTKEFTEAARLADNVSRDISEAVDWVLSIEGK